MQLLTNHIGYERIGFKQAILLAFPPLTNAYAELIQVSNECTLIQLPLKVSGSTDEWSHSHSYTIDFSEVESVGEFYLKVGTCQSHVFCIREGVLMQKTFSDVLHYFKSQRSGGAFDKQDRQASILKSDIKIDVHGGWYDASGDVSKYLSHLSYANYLNPQQTPMVVWNMLKGLELLKDATTVTDYSRVRLVEEALHGADFLMRMQHPDGYFYMTVFDKWSKDITQREVCAFSTQDGHKSSDYHAGFRQGGGVSIAALAAASRVSICGDFSNQEYLQAAILGYWHLKEYNLSYLNDGIENIIDEYCALLASVELFKSTHEQRYLSEAQNWALRLASRQQSDENQTHFWSANDDGSRPYSHAAEAGLPVIALSQYLAIEKNADKVKHFSLVVSNALQFELSISSEVNNPFGYPRQYIKPVSTQKQSAFFVAHDNESGYWWQGENARLGSLAAMVYLAKPWINEESMHTKLDQFAQHSLNWIVGLNPFDICMLDGHGHNNPDYLPQLGFFNAKGGVCNGITSGFENEHDVAFNPAPHKDDVLQNWRWGEQWIPHAAWYLLAIMSQFSEANND
jgi:hypothetical protein